MPHLRVTTHVRLPWKFLAAEHRCKRVNQRFRAIRRTGRDPYGAEIWHARNWIQYVLGHTPDLQKISKSCDITPGASLGVHGNATNLARKLAASSWTVTPSALPYALGAVWSNDHLRELVLVDEQRQYYSVDPDLFRVNLLSKVKMVRHNKISFVPKTAKTDRSIAVEPFLNTYLQRGVDVFIRNRLKRVNLNLEDQARNCELARLGSLPDEDPYCTIDLSSASDTLATEVVRELLPPEWFELLNDLRSHNYEHNGSLVRYHKFVSMGNGFCFPLETLIFASLCHAVYVSSGQKPDFRVYGDDIIVRRSVFDGVMKLLDFAGFIPNPRKTFKEGPFRESCGMDWHSGVNVRPIYLDHPLDSLSRLFGFHNQSLRRESYVRHYFDEIREWLYELLPRNVRLCAPCDPATRDSTSNWEGTTIDGAFWVPLDRFMGSAFARWNRDSQSWGWFSILKTARVDRAFRPMKSNNSLLHLIGALRGSDSSKPFTLRYSTEDKLVLVN